MRCELCKTYYNAKRVEEKVPIGKNKETVIINRLCSHLEKIVNRDDDGCEKFSPTKFFWCPGWDSWASVPECQNRQRKEKYKTCPCSIGLEVAEIIYKPVKKLVIRKPKLIFRRQK